MGTIVYRTIAQALAEFVNLNFFGYLFATSFSTSPYMFTRGREGERGRGGEGEGEGERGGGGERGRAPAPTEILFNLQTIQHCSDNSPDAQTQSPSQAD